MITCSTWAAERNWTHAAITHLSLDFGLYSSLYSYVYDVTVLYSYVYDVLGTISVLEYWVRSAHTFCTRVLGTKRVETATSAVRADSNRWRTANGRTTAVGRCITRKRASTWSG